VNGRKTRINQSINQHAHRPSNFISPLLTTLAFSLHSRPSPPHPSLAPITLSSFNLHSAAHNPSLPHPSLPHFTPALHSLPSFPPFTPAFLSADSPPYPSPFIPPPLTLHSCPALCHASPCIPLVFTRHSPAIHSRPSLCRPSLALFTTPPFTLQPVAFHCRPTLRRP
jgi:hypothetical protein